MKKVMKSVWDKIPTLDQAMSRIFGYTPKPTNSIKPLVLFLLVTLVMLWTQRFFNSSYPITLSVLLISDVILMFLVLCLIKTYGGWIRKLFIFEFIIQIALVMFLLFPVTFLSQTATTNKAHQSNITYVTYSPTCPYCKIAHMNMLRAVAAYNASHADTIQLINVDKKTKITKDVLDYIQYKGTIIRFKGNKATQSQYTLGNSKGPVKPSATYIYKELTSIK